MHKNHYYRISHYINGDVDVFCYTCQERVEAKEIIGTLVEEVKK